MLGWRTENRTNQIQSVEGALVHQEPRSEDGRVARMRYPARNLYFVNFADSAHVWRHV